ncbi:Crp/Fnr family transcriptional regulator [Mariprofundus sp. EBB-1]|uniref:Crp/Fnr family transcriptional regulator n=1 Tax=Mariprofundus sp. EBB-1 TaxID=2650971 RepID=UPI000EF179B0|nr:Crp/Fnr family transcriptional regulator [Mariprofundus sp. EBB-1]RLL54741.1 Crp/Fnr family transcriptional regulator [Mariprofundus sp. EBB-1]
MTADQIYSAIQNISWFKDLNGDSLQHIAEHSYCFRFEKKHSIIRQGDVSKGLYITVQGNIKVAFLSRKGKEHIVRIASPGHTFAEVLVFTKQVSPVNVETLTKAKVILIPSEILLKLITEDSVAACNIIHDLSHQMYMMVKSMGSMTVTSSKHRVIGFLLSRLLANSNDGGQVTLKLAKLDIASSLNITPETFSRILHELSEDGLISINNKVIEVHSIEKLRSSS